MRRSEIYKVILKDVFKRMRDNTDIDNDVYDDVSDYISSGEFCNIECDIVPAEYKVVVKAIVGWDGNNDAEISVGSNIYYETATSEQLVYYQEISVFSSSPKFALISVSNLYEDIRSNDADNFLRNIELIWSAIYDNNAHKDKFWQICNVKERNYFYLITEEVLTSEEEKWNAYSYGYMLYANEKSYLRDSLLDFTKERTFNAVIPYNKANRYCQYYEVFDLISESHYCDDILRRYLNMYLIIENMCYRRNLAKLSHGTKRGFVRHSIAIASRANKNEASEIINGIKELFPDIRLDITTTDINPYNTFLEKEYAISNTGHNDDKIAKIIYSRPLKVISNIDIQEIGV